MNRLAGEGTRAGGARELQGLGRQSVSTQQAFQAFDPAGTMRFQAVPDARSMPGTEGMANEENKRGRDADEDGMEGGAGLLGLEGI